jgi:hypothetical protein
MTVKRVFVNVSSCTSGRKVENGMLMQKWPDTNEKLLLKSGKL